MSAEIRIICDFCGESKYLPEDKLKPHLNKRMKVRCDKCHKITSLIIDHQLLTEKIYDPTVLHTNVLDGPIDFSPDELSFQVIPDNHGEGTSFEVAEGESVIGRLPGKSTSDHYIGIQTKDMRMSKVHCRVRKYERKDQTVHTIMDEKSVNGVFVNDQKLFPKDEIILVPGMIIQLGSTKIEVI